MLLGLGARLTEEQTIDVIRKGRGRMPAVADLDEDDLNALLTYLDVQPAVYSPLDDGQTAPDRYNFTGYHRFVDPDGYPAIAPPWGTLNAVDLKTGKFLWKIPFGEFPQLASQGVKNTGSESYGGPIVTAGGVLFIGATVADRKFRAFDTRNGNLLWEAELPFAGVATPSTYMIDGRQYVVIAASGGRDSHSPLGGAYVAFALPK
jgi:quinoprotein glucose dehydrogenase